MKKHVSMLVALVLAVCFLMGSVAMAESLSDKVVNVGYGTAIDSLTPFRSNTARNAPFFMQIYETLGVLTADRELVPYAAKSWSTDDNGYTYTVEIWDTISDSAGNAITAADVVWFVNESKARGLKPVYSKVESCEQTGDYTFTIKLTDNMYGSFQTLLQDTYIISQAAFEGSADEFGSTCVTTSPYVVTEFTSSVSISLERRDDYWQDIANLPECVVPNAKTVNYSIITEASQMGIALETGLIDVAIDIASTTGAQFIDNPSYTVNLTDGPQGWQVFFSGHESSVVANDVALRQAICYGIDANGLIMGTSAGYATQMWDVASPMLIGFNPEWQNEDYYTYDAAKAADLLKQSSYNGQTIRILSTSSAMASRTAQILQNFLVGMGINAEVNSVDMALYTSIRLDGSQYDLVINTVGGYSLADFWSIRFDPAAYPTGDATSRHDEVLAEMMYKTWTNDGWTQENIDEVHNYIKDNAIAYGLVNPQVFTIWSNNAGLTEEVCGGISGYVVPSACKF